MITKIKLTLIIDLSIDVIDTGETRRLTSHIK